MYICVENIKVLHGAIIISMKITIFSESKPCPLWYHTTKTTFLRILSIHENFTVKIKGVTLAIRTTNLTTFTSHANFA